MAYHLKNDESVPEGIRRIVRAELDEVVQQLRGKKNKRDEAIHEARKSIKKARAALRLARLELGDLYERETVWLRDAGRTLSEFRDAGAMIGTFDDLQKQEKKPLGRHAEQVVRHGLAAHKSQVERERNLDHLLPKIAASIAEARKRTSDWPLRTDGFGAFEDSFEKTFRDGRKSLDKVREDARPEQFHELRKRVKDHWYHVRLLENVWEDFMKGYEDSLKQLETRLGDDHNLVLLRELIVAAPENYGKPPDLDLLCNNIDKYQKHLREDALTLGKLVYSERPRHLVKRIRNLWEVWRKAA